jgi:hypothetical protein
MDVSNGTGEFFGKLSFCISACPRFGQARNARGESLLLEGRCSLAVLLYYGANFWWSCCAEVPILAGFPNTAFSQHLPPPLDDLVDGPILARVRRFQILKHGFCDHFHRTFGIAFSRPVLLPQRERVPFEDFAPSRGHNLVFHLACAGGSVPSLRQVDVNYFAG